MLKQSMMALSVLFGWMVLGLGSRPCLADGFIVIHNPPEQMVPGHFAFAPLEVTYHHVAVEINDQVATTSVDQEFYNPNSQVLEGTYLFPLPSGSHIDKFSMDINGTMMDAELLPADKARAIYEEIVRKMRDPALLEYVGRDAFKVRIYPIPGNSRKKIKLSYTQLLKSDTGLVEYTYPMNTEKFSAKPLQEVSVKVSLNCKDSLKSIYSPTNNVQIKREGERHATIGWEQKNFRPDTDFKLIFSRSRQAVGVDLLTYRQSGEDGYFLLMASPGLEAPRGSVQKKDICFVLDTSGSMAGPKMEQAKKALSFCVNNLNETDRFEVIRFSTECEPLFGQLKPATRENVDKALAFVKDLKAIGGTAIQDALHQAFRCTGFQTVSGNAKDTASAEHGPEAHATQQIIFLTDGEPTIGETNEDALVSQATRESGGNTRVFCFGIGNDVNTHLLDRVASETKALSTYVAPEEDIEIKVSNFYTKIKEPVLSDVQVAFTGENIRTTQLYPTQLPGLFKGEMLIAFGRYSGKGALAVKITGTLNGEPQTFATDVQFADQDTANAFIPRLWATRRVGYLLDQIRMHGESKELKDEVTRLARDHGIVTPYTAYLILEDEKHRNVPLALQSMRELGEDDRVRRESAGRFQQAGAEAKDASARTGAKALAAARDVNELRNKENLDQYDQRGQGQSEQPGLAKSAAPAPAPGGAGGPAAVNGHGGRPGDAANFATTAPFGYRIAQNYTQQSRVLNGRAFFQNGNTWTDATAQTRANLKQKKVAFNSDEYFDLLKNHPEAAAWFALGTEVDVVLGETLYIVR